MRPTATGPQEAMTGQAWNRKGQPNRAVLEHARALLLALADVEVDVGKRVDRAVTGLEGEAEPSGFYDRPALFRYPHALPVTRIARPGRSPRRSG